ncbi:MAG: hypothetical protein VKK97_04910 [Synechococcaceae cyanobacterium]|nr:hypothetical protein [Synechococcaceae cyanobacterium]
MAFTFLIVIFPALMAILICSRRDKSLRNEIACISLICYPVVFAFTRGHPIAYVSGALIMLSATCFGFARKNAAIVLGLIAVGFRPNLFPFAIFYIFSEPRHSLRQRLGVFLLFALAFSLWNFLLFGIAHHLYPAYTFNSFLDGYSFYSRGEEEATGFSGIGSSLYGAERFLIYSAGFYGAWVPWIFKKINLILGLAFSVLIALDYAQGKLAPNRALFLVALAVIVETPLLADYHLIPFLSVFVIPLQRSCVVRLEPSNSLGSANKKWNFFTFSMPDLIFSERLDRFMVGFRSVGKIALCLMLVPLAYYIVPSRLVSFGALLRPAFAIASLAIWLLPGLRDRSSMRTGSLES